MAKDTFHWTRITRYTKCGSYSKKSGARTVNTFTRSGTLAGLKANALAVASGREKPITWCWRRKGRPKEENGSR